MVEVPTTGQLDTRSLETRSVVRASVRSAELLETGDTWLLLKTAAVMAARTHISSADAAMFERQHVAGVGQTVEGRLRVDLLSDTAIRVRYAQGTSVVSNDTPMVVGRLPGPSQCRLNLHAEPMHIRDSSIPDASAGRSADPDFGRTLELVTGKLRVGVCLNPYRIEIRDLSGRKVCGVGGPEKDNFCAWDAINTGICRVLGSGAPVATECFDLLHDECIYGLGERFIRLNKVGQTVDLDMIDALGVSSPRAYKNVPFYVSSGGYGVFFNHSSRMTYWVGSSSAMDVQVAAEDDFLDYFIFAGTIKQVLAEYTALTGKGAVPPKWTFGYWQSKISYKSAEETMEIARELRRHEVPCDVIHLDTHWFAWDWLCDLKFDPQRFPDPKAYFDELARLGFKVSLWQLPYIPEGSKLFDDLKAVGGFVRSAEGGMYDLKLCYTPGFKGAVGVVDYTNPEAVRVHQEALRQLFRLGAKVIKTDFGEAAPMDGVYHDGTPGHRMHNLYPLLYNKAVFEVTREATGDGVVWARSAWAGSQRYPIHWGGDNSPNYHNMAPQLEGGLSFGLSGFQFWSQDIGGFCGTLDENLLIRWMQLGMFLSHSRIHGYGDRELYKFSPRTLKICREYIRLRYRLMPYIYGAAMQCVEQSLPMARALVVEYQDDPNVRTLADQYLFGPSLMVAPIFDETTRRRVYLPAGAWTDWWTHERITGGRWIDVEAELEVLPLFIREGAIIPMGPVMNYVDEKPLEAVDLLVSLYHADGCTEFTVPVNGRQIAVQYRAHAKRHVLSIGPSDVPFNVQALGKGKLTVKRG